ncbi:N-acetylmuramoyl-L-alanine amidase [Bacillus velezensis]|uniref:N-acetylmuramoyl-L-alanine amidase n=1 Tax=Bacillus velezensis TaxID=492670 RepID=UPI002079BA83|nr:N-acetylmuramoyl-L-alanine amidase [Bacillus velezensis]MEC1923717.1 N-acetylmuramoyl-L-alanine amidase [Bacillus velezensis]USK19437.1 N-acetylmuramoyl-L-alanine amidase [Bacillus velezensis]WDV40949.1 N-acetylmuramoyl-L-alanine amidase [Bacillus velezensis]
MVKITKDFIPVGHNNRPGYAMDPAYITVHNTANTAKGASAAMHARYEKNPETPTSWHFTVDDKEIYQHLPLNESGWHAGDGNGTGNRKSIGIEICENSDGDFKKAVANAQWLIKKLMKDQGISLANVVPHQHWSGKYCPRKLLDRWDSFKAGISGAPSKTVNSPVDKTKESYIKNTVVADSLNVRTQRNANSSIVLALPKGSAVQYKKGSTQNGWGYIKYTNSKGATYSGYVNVSYIKSDAELGKTPSKSAPSKSSNKTTGGIKSVGKIKIVGVKSAAIIMDKPDRKNAKNVDTIGLGKTINISGSVKGSNNSKGYWEVIHGGKRRYVSGQYGKMV